NRVGGTADGFGRVLYQDTLNRAVDPATTGAIDQKMADGVNRTAIALAVLTSTEYQQRLVETLYQQCLERSADATGLNAGVVALQSGAYDQQIIAGLMG